MKVLLDSCVWKGARETLRESGHEVEWTGDGPDPGDSEILMRAIREVRVLITLDKDFGELAVIGNVRHHGIVRLVGVRATEQGTVSAEVLRKYGSELSSGAIVTVEPARVRIRRFED